MINKTYDCGMRLVFEQNKAISATAIKIYCLVGGRDEDDSNRGIAHLLEHMFFKGTESRTSSQINSTFDKLGVIVNAFTDYDRTCFYAQGLSEHLETMIEVMSDCLFNSTYPSQELAKEKTVVCSELEMYQNDFENLAGTNAVTIGLQGTGYDYVLGGTPESVSKLTTEDLVNFRDKWYTPDRIVVSVCGDVDFDTVDNLVQKYLIKANFIAKSPISFHYDCVLPKIVKRSFFESKETDQVYGYLNFRGINKSSEDIVAFNLARLALGSTTTSRLFVKLREEHGLVYVIGTSPCLFYDCGVNAINFISSAINAPKVVSLIRETIDEAKENGFDSNELMTFKNIAKSSLVFSQQTISARAGKNAETLIYTDQQFDMSEELAKIDAVTLSEMNSALRKYFDYNFLTVSVVAKEDKVLATKIFGIE